jgi:hypothetical protein
MREHLSARQVVDSDDFDVAPLCGNASYAAADATEAINSDFRRHGSDSLPAAARMEGAAGEVGT